MENNYKSDLKDFKYFADQFYQLILEYQYKVHEWIGMDFPEFYISQFHISENLYFKDYPDKLENNNYDIFGHGHLVNNKDCEDFIYRDSASHTQTGHAFGVKNYVFLTVYDKRYKDPDHALERFKTFQFYRREWKVQKKKIKSLKLNHYKEFLLLIDNVQLFKYMISSIRKTVDIVLKNDDSEYCIFHFEEIDLNVYKSIKDQVTNFGKKAILKLSSKAGKYVPLSHRNTIFWDGVDVIAGIAKKHRHKWTLDKWIKATTSMLNEPDRLPIKEDSHVDIDKVKEFLEHIKYK